jgi:hypothetical protein
MAAKLTRLTHKIAVQLHVVEESCNISSSRCWWPVRKLLDTPSYIFAPLFFTDFDKTQYNVLLLYECFHDFNSL